MSLKLFVRKGLGFKLTYSLEKTAIKKKIYIYTVYIYTYIHTVVVKNIVTLGKYDQRRL